MILKKILCGNMVKKIPPFRLKDEDSLSFLIIFFPKQYLNCSVTLHVAISKYIWLLKYSLVGRKGRRGGDLAMMHISIHGSSAFTFSMNTLHTKSYKVTGVFILYTHVSQLIARSCIFIWHLFSIIEDFLLRGLVILNTFYWYMYMANSSHGKVQNIADHLDLVYQQKYQ